jgi:hypothetical protein
MRQQLAPGRCIVADAGGFGDNSRSMDQAPVMSFEFNSGSEDVEIESTPNFKSTAAPRVDEEAAAAQHEAWGDDIEAHDTLPDDDGGDYYSHEATGDELSEATENRVTGTQNGMLRRQRLEVVLQPLPKHIRAEYKTPPRSNNVLSVLSKIPTEPEDEEWYQVEFDDGAEDLVRPFRSMSSFFRYSLQPS